MFFFILLFYFTRSPVTVRAAARLQAAVVVVVARCSRNGWRRTSPAPTSPTAPAAWGTSRRRWPAWSDSPPRGSTSAKVSELAMPIFFFCSNSPVHSILFHCLLLIEKLANLCCLELLAAFVLEGRQGSESRKRLANRERARGEGIKIFVLLLANSCWPKHKTRILGSVCCSQSVINYQATKREWAIIGRQNNKKNAFLLWKQV